MNSDAPLPSEVWEKGACRDAPTEIFYPERDAATYRDIADQAKQICRGSSTAETCPVLLPCLFYGLITEDRFGIWGGLSARERNALRRSMTLDRYKAAQQYRGSRYWALIENYLEQRNGEAQATDEDDEEAEDPG